MTHEQATRILRCAATEVMNQIYEIMNGAIESRINGGVPEVKDVLTKLSVSLEILKEARQATKPENIK